ncbi:MAG: hypothetical protein F4X66_01610 [Chloroflexi bacterium]|nr:hypothetical protein [Chloroflexota bacterium]MYE39420.1 hypothetical protein [Chloroflexota bacterium]
MRPSPSGRRRCAGVALLKRVGLQAARIISREKSDVLETVSASSRRTDRVDERRDYVALGIAEYWRFDAASR